MSNMRLSALRSSCWALCLAATFLSGVHGDLSSCVGSTTTWTAQVDSDLHEFVTRPDLRAPKFNVSLSNKRKASPGYLFVAPYDEIAGHEPSNEHRTLQVGPHIYASDGELVWSGAGLFNNRPSFDFKQVFIDGKAYLSFVLPMWRENCAFSKGAGVVLDSSYELAMNMTFDGDNVVFDLHEFNILNGKSALILGQSTVAADSDDVGPSDFHGLRRDQTVREVDLQTRETLFEWRSTNAISETNVPFPDDLSDEAAKRMGMEWDYFHPNSIDKTKDGNFLVSARHTDTIYLISGHDNSTIWRLGGKNSSFVQHGFNFSRQHDARIRSEDSTGMTISFLDNAKAEWELTSTADASSVLVVKLNTATSPMTATVVERIRTPDGRLTGRRGNAQFLANGNRFINWADSAYLSEHTPDGELVYQAEWTTDRWSTYRAYKYDFTGHPLEKPTVKSFASARSDGGLATNVYVSWNGATEVKNWRVRDSTGTLVKKAKKAGFETVIVCNGHYPAVSVEAIDSSGLSLSASSLVQTELPPSWNMSSGMHYGMMTTPSTQFGGLAFSSFVAFVLGAVFWSICLRYGPRSTFRLKFGKRSQYSAVPLQER